MNIQKLQVCLLAIIAVALVYIAVTYTNANRYVPLAGLDGTLDTRTGNVYLLHKSNKTSIYGRVFRLYDYGYATVSPEFIEFAKKTGKGKIDWRDYAGTEPQPNKQAPRNNNSKNIVDEILKGN